ncbi:hypothetical protein D3C78_1200700 [compost metagenome]
MIAVIAANRSSEYHIQRLQAGLNREHQNAVISGDVLAWQAFNLTVNTISNRVYQDGAQVRAAVVGIGQRRHQTQWPALRRPENGEAIERGFHCGFGGVPFDLHGTHGIIT